MLVAQVDLRSLLAFQFTSDVAPTALLFVTFLGIPELLSLLYFSS